MARGYKRGRRQHKKHFQHGGGKLTDLILKYGPDLAVKLVSPIVSSLGEKVGNLIHPKKSGGSSRLPSGGSSRLPSGGKLKNYKTTMPRDYLTEHDITPLSNTKRGGSSRLQ